VKQTPEVVCSRLLRPVVDDDESLAIASPRATDGFQALPDYAKSVVHADDDVDPAVSLSRNPLLPDLCIRRPRIGIHHRPLKGIDQLLPIPLQGELDPWSASATGKIWQPLCFAAPQLNCQDTSHRFAVGRIRPVCGPVTGPLKRCFSYRLHGPQGRGYSGYSFI
jgi:hypothetical protein